MADINKNFTVGDIMRDVPKKDVLLLASALLFAVYGWSPKKLQKMKLESVRRWVIYAKRRMTFGDAYKLRGLTKKKRRQWWKKLLKIDI